MIILNFAHPLTPPRLDQVATLVSNMPDRVQDIRAQFNLEHPFNQQITYLLDDLNVLTQRW